ncbi:hypothetical protein EPN15_03455 [Patescibacteria group bacterium]|nr:MAG: hypothetical protein EPN15_03455 [Patescibacteria group bacterium]
MDNENNHNPEPTQEMPLVDIGKDNHDQTDQQKRDERILQIDQELAEFSVKAQTEDEINAVQMERDQEYQNKIQELETGLSQPLSEETKDKIHQNMVDSVIDRARRVNNKFDNLQILRNTENLITNMESLGAKIDNNSRIRLVEILSSPQILHVNRRELVKLFGVDEKDDALVRKLYQPFNEKYGKLLKEWLIKENKFFSPNQKLN